MATAFSFHCMICFEEFDVMVRYPVVLPCGHTYVCKECADKLERCMECRTPLVITMPRENPQLGSANSPFRPRYGSGRGHSKPPPPQPPIKKRLPLPKNVVLLSLIEATELAAQKASAGANPAIDKSLSLAGSSSGQGDGGTLQPHPALGSGLSYTETDEEERIRAGTSLALSECGTYAVAAKDGLDIFPSRPEDLQALSQDETSERDVEHMVRFFHLDHKLEVENDAKETKENDAKPVMKIPGRLRLGDRVQIVSIEAGWAKMARGYGYVKADNNQLVKVGGAVDRACNLEAYLRLLSSRRKQLKKDQSKMDNQFIALMNDLQAALMSGEDLTVIVSETFQKKKDSEHSARETPIQRLEDSVERVEAPKPADHTPLKPRPSERPITPPTASESHGFFCNSSDVFDAVPSVSSSVPALPAPAASPHSRTLMPSNSMEGQIRRTSSHPSPDSLRAGARAWRDMNGRRPYTGVDFRTGLSGHLGAMSSTSHPHDFLEIPKSRTEIWGMSNHTGLSRWKSSSTTRRHTGYVGSPSAQHLGIPAIGSESPSPPRDDPAQTLSCGTPGMWSSPASNNGGPPPLPTSAGSHRSS